MQHHFRILVVALALVSPVAAAWGGKGQYEPDTALDRTGGWMWSTPDWTKQTVAPGYGSKVYFNAITVQNTGYVTHGFSDNPNFATLQTSRQAWPGNVAALLGVWKDCNKDGYIGLNDNVAFEYRAELLLGEFSVCPPQAAAPVPVSTPSNPNGNHESFNYQGVHNDGVWVREFIPLGPALNNPNIPIQKDANPFDLNDKFARVWADWGQPNSPPASSVCYVVNAPIGTYHSTGGLLHYVDCVDAYLLTDTYNQAIAAVGGDNLGAGQLSFKDQPRETQNSASLLNQENPYGDEGGASMVTAFDCSSPIVPATGGVRVPSAVTPSTNPSGSVGGTVNETENAFQDCDRSKGGTGNIEHVPYAAEQQGSLNGVGVRLQNDFPMQYNEGQRPGTGSRAELGAADPKDQGLRAWDSEGIWISGSRVAEDRNPFVDRDNIRNAQPIAKVQYISAYAYVSPTAIAKYHLQLNPTNKADAYGKANCPTIGTGAGINNGWQCDPAGWAADCVDGYECTGTIEGNSQVPIGVVVGQVYQLRDIDCYDSSAAGARPTISWGTLTGTACAR